MMAVAYLNEEDRINLIARSSSGLRVANCRGNRGCTRSVCVLWVLYPSLRSTMNLYPTNSYKEIQL